MPIHEGRDELPYEDISDTLEGRFIASYRAELKRLKAEVRRLSGQIKREEAHAERNLRRWEKAQQHIQELEAERDKERYAREQVEQRCDPGTARWIADWRRAMAEKVCQCKRCLHCGYKHYCNLAVVHPDGRVRAGGCPAKIADDPLCLRSPSALPRRRIAGRKPE
jgi:hypothetical protein